MNIVDFDLFSSIFRAAAENEDAFDYASYHDGYAFVVTKKTGKDLIGISIANRATDSKNDGHTSPAQGQRLAWGNV